VKVDPRRVLLTLSTAGALLFAAPAAGYAQGAATSTSGSQIGVYQEDDDGTVDDQTAFIRTAVSDAATKIRAGELARDRADSSEVRDFADRLIREHGSLMTDAAEVAADFDVDAPQEPRDEDEVALIDDLDEMTGDDFDETYLRAFVHDQRTQIADYESASATMDEGVAEFANRHLDTLREQLQDAEELADRLDVAIDLDQEDAT
jgi:putative membrane protein